MTATSFILLAVCVCFTQAIPGLVDHGQDLSDVFKFKKVSGYFRIEANIIRFENPRGTTRHYTPCDLVPGSCDPKITGVIDYHTPNNDFGKDSVKYKYYQHLYDGEGKRNVDFNGTLVKDVCNHSTRKVNVRIRAMDNDWLRDDTIDHWSCFIFTDPPPAASLDESQWSEDKVCEGHNGSHKITWRYRWYFVKPEECVEKDGSSWLITRLIPGIGKK